MTANGTSPSRIVLAVLLSATTASASAVFPGVVKDELHLAAAPPCTLCHQTDSGGAHTATKPFGRTMTSFGVTGGNVGALRAALLQDEQQGTDSDGDGTPDVVELQHGTDPNRAEAADGGELAVPGGPPELLTGCSVARSSERRSNPTSPLPAPVALALSVLALSAVRGRIRRSRLLSRMDRMGPSSIASLKDQVRT